tara:strand:+ start:12626 stop:12988 length:363 start_codon:yes stop_codon:yes gene_type:complete
MKKNKCKKFKEYVEAYKAVSNANNSAERSWIDRGKYYPEMKEYPYFEWSDEALAAKFDHAVFIRLVGKKFDEGNESVSKFTFLLHEYFVHNNKSIECQEIEKKWGGLMDLNAIKLSNSCG